MGRGQRSKKPRMAMPPMMNPMMNPAMMMMNPMMNPMAAFMGMGQQMGQGQQPTEDDTSSEAEQPVPSAKATGLVVSSQPLQDAASSAASVPLPAMAAAVAEEQVNPGTLQAKAVQSLKDRRAYLFSSIGDKKIHRGAAMIRGLPKDRESNIALASCRELSFFYKFNFFS